MIKNYIMKKRELTIEKRGINNLNPHPTHQSIYTTPSDIKSEWKDLYSGMKENGLLNPIIVSQDNIIVSGVRRWLVAKELGWVDIDVIPYNGIQDDIEMLIVTSNANREKTYSEKVNEAIHLLNILGNRQGRRNLPENEKGSKYEIIAEKLGAGFSKDNISKISKILKHDKSNPNQENKFIDLLKKGAPIDAVVKLINNDTQKENDIENIIIKEGKYTLINNDCINGLSELKDSFIDMCFTSPPYFNLRLYYGIDSVRNPNNIGEEDSVDDYIKNLGKIGAEVFRVLKPKGSFFLNIGDTIENGENLAIPELLLVEMKRIGFKLANRIVWKKSNAKPCRLKSGYGPNYEFVLHFVKQNDYKCRQLVWSSGEKSKITRGVGDRKMNGQKEKKTMMLETPYRQFKTFYDENEGYTNIIKSAVATAKNLSDIDKDLDHPAIFPETLPLLPLLQTTEIGDKVLDVFGGSSTLGVVSNLFGREYIGMELNKEYHRVSAIRMNHIQSKINFDIYEEIDRMAA
jgi:site-specific DNA-methyltransferase (adenine-specific)/site-specific DNA-methyltransferase (cytosine-N4-specific)